MNELERLTKLTELQKQLISVLQEGAKKDAKIIALYQDVERAQGSAITILGETIDKLKLLIP